MGTRTLLSRDLVYSQICCSASILLGKQLFSPSPYEAPVDFLGTEDSSVLVQQE